MVGRPWQCGFPWLAPLRDLRQGHDEARGRQKSLATRKTPAMSLATGEKADTVDSKSVLTPEMADGEGSKWNVLAAHSLRSGSKRKGNVPEF